MTEWRLANDPPPMRDGGCNIYSSIPVLGVDRYGYISVVVLEQYDDGDVIWYTNDSEHWNLGNTITHWMPLPELPKEK